jgi:dimethylaniline monooxygenase (N-oxide forming)
MGGQRTAARGPIAVIGAGAAGLISAKTMSQAGFDVVVLEQGSRIGGMWDIDNDNGFAVAYRTLHINTDTYLTQLRDYPFRDGVADYAHHTEMLEYLRGYASNFGVDKLIRFGSKVTGLTPVPANEGGGWDVEVNGAPSGRFRAVIVATGHLHLPRWPDLPGDFTGEYLHAASYRDPKPFLDRRICIIGFGNSALDIATDLAHVGARVVVSARTGAFIWPKYAFGYPLTRMAGRVHDLRFLPLGAKTWLSRTLNRIVVRMVWGRMSDYGIRLPEKKAHPISNQFFLSHVKYGRVVLKGGIRLIEDRTIRFDDGTSEEFDALIAATGYSVAFPFLDSSLLGNQDTVLPLYRRVVPPDLPGLYFIGYFNLDWASNPVYEQQAIWVRNIELGACDLPSSQDMWGEVGERRRRIESEFHNAPRMNLEVEYGPYVHELKRAQRWRGTGRSSRAA